MKILVTGGTGSLGRALTRYLIDAGHTVTVLSRDAHKQANLLRALHAPPNLRFVLGDICDPVAQLNACYARDGRPQDVLIHAAALKHLDRGETDPDEYIRVNVTGATAMARRATECGIKKALLICTDKAVSPLNTYGVTKALAERAWIKANHTWHQTQFAAIRYGNVIDSDGAVLHVWREQVTRGHRLCVREPEPTRFVLTITQALALVTEALDTMADGQVLVPCDLPAISMWDLARLFQPEYLWKREPLTLGEKQHEVLLAEGEYAYPASEHLAVATTTHDRPSLPTNQFHSNLTRRLTTQELKELINYQEGTHELSRNSRTREQLVAA